MSAQLWRKYGSLTTRVAATVTVIVGIVGSLLVQLGLFTDLDSSLGSESNNRVHMISLRWFWVYVVVSIVLLVAVVAVICSAGIRSTSVVESCGVAVILAVLATLVCAYNVRNLAASPDVTASSAAERAAVPVFCVCVPFVSISIVLCSVALGEWFQCFVRKSVLIIRYSRLRGLDPSLPELALWKSGNDHKITIKACVAVEKNATNKSLISSIVAKWIFPVLLLLLVSDAGESDVVHFIARWLRGDQFKHEIVSLFDPSGLGGSWRGLWLLMLPGLFYVLVKHVSDALRWIRWQTIKSQIAPGSRWTRWFSEFAM